MAETERISAIPDTAEQVLKSQGGDQRLEGLRLLSHDLEFAEVDREKNRIRLIFKGTPPYSAEQFNTQRIKRKDPLRIFATLRGQLSAALHSVMEKTSPHIQFGPNCVLLNYDNSEDLALAERLIAPLCAAPSIIALREEGRSLLKEKLSFASVDMEDRIIHLEFKPGVSLYEADEIEDQVTPKLVRIRQALTAACDALGLKRPQHILFGASGIGLRFGRVDAVEDCENAGWVLERFMAKKRLPQDRAGQVRLPVLAEKALEQAAATAESVPVFFAEEGEAFLHENFHTLRFCDDAQTLTLVLKPGAYPYHMDEVEEDAGVPATKDKKKQRTGNLARVEAALNAIFEQRDIAEIPQYRFHGGMVDLVYKNAASYFNAQNMLGQCGMAMVEDNSKLSKVMTAEESFAARADKEQLRHNFIIFPDDANRRFLIYSKSLAHEAMGEKTSRVGLALVKHLEKQGIRAHYILTEEQGGPVSVAVEGGAGEYSKAKNAAAELLHKTEHAGPSH